MIDYREGAKCEAVCGYCKKSVSATLTKVTLSLCKGLEEVESVLVDICDECGNLIAIPARSLPPIQQAYKRLVETKTVSDYGEITTELKSKVDARKKLNKKSELDYQNEYRLAAD